MFGRARRGSRGGAGASGGAGAPGRVGGASGPARRHGRRPIRSSLTGPGLPDPDGRVVRFEVDARATVELLQSVLPEELEGVNIGFATVPVAGLSGAPRRVSADASTQPMYYSVDRGARTIMLYRMPIQRAPVLHVDDPDHRRFFVQHCVYRAVCDYLGREPWELLPGRFDHY
ncbi:hypothetical protein JD276_01425 [Leucobacter sp. CSA1]|uniref:Metallopeptidase family protein n=1 Tax=Leucobacter chromiisoli TaxID=2796471 RepID=A0A934Q4Y3_9MICO|nr:hypothetical protein [Leucobacter chromiisoli]MBK0417698.1 hypothetical protein [Leucobacter chromiisoli]